VKLLIDECIGKGIYASVKPSLDSAQPPITHAHILDFNKASGVADDVWVPRVAQGGWVVVTGDTGAKKLGAPLQIIMPQYKVTGVYFSGKLQQQPGQVKISALIWMLQHRHRVESAPQGTRFKLFSFRPGVNAINEWPLTQREVFVLQQLPSV